MNLNDFKLLWEIQNLQDKTKKHLGNITEAEGRISFLEKQRGHSQAELDEKTKSLSALRDELPTLEKDLFRIESDLEKAQENLGMATNEQQIKATENQILQLQPKKEGVEDLLFSNMEFCEKYESESNQLETFLKGSADTLKEIVAEVTVTKAAEQKEIDYYQGRITGILNEIPAQLKTAFESVDKIFHLKHPMAKIQSSYCTECRFHVGRNAESEVEQAQSIEFCQGCGRLLIPYTG